MDPASWFDLSNVRVGQELTRLATGNKHKAVVREIRLGEFVCEVHTADPKILIFNATTGVCVLGRREGLVINTPLNKVPENLYQILQEYYFTDCSHDELKTALEDWLFIA